ncbi:type III secretion system chaperone [Bordetella sp. BOR01]|uniref:type III secretion system chaperone n=1 Tax=Bordetella sp. BOR01 TaxID=2854779 RepID=UPI001C443478|nr:type III secretion system chaperone [Bordetella sp. BOR01]MBV7485221.1 type III secretion system chaperone [Bordetella sp. BOR01]
MQASTLVALFGQEAGIELSLGDTGTLALAFENGITLNLEHDAAVDRLHCYAVVGLEPADPAQRLTWYRAMLAANAFGYDTDGATLGLDEVTGDLLLTRRLDLDRADVQALSQMVESMAQVALEWRDRLVTTVSVGSKPEPTGPLTAFEQRA